MANHLIFSNLGSTAAIEHLPTSHPLRRFLRPFRYALCRARLLLLMAVYEVPKIDVMCAVMAL
jgi:hypothetical protein